MAAETYPAIWIPEYMGAPNQDAGRVLIRNHQQLFRA
jgi:hypothetical protein